MIVSQSIEAESKGGMAAQVARHAFFVPQDLFVSQSFAWQELRVICRARIKCDAKTTWQTWHTTRKPWKSPGFSGGYVVCQLAHHGTPHVAQHASLRQVRQAHLKQAQVKEVGDQKLRD
jgi:hypothetical protein